MISCPLGKNAHAPCLLIQRRQIYLINRHPTARLSSTHGRHTKLLLIHLPTIIDILISLLARAQVRLQALVEIVHAPDGVDNGEDEHQDGDDGEEGERVAGGFVVIYACLVAAVHTEQLEEKVGQTAKVQDLISSN